MKFKNLTVLLLMVIVSASCAHVVHTERRISQSALSGVRVSDKNRAVTYVPLLPDVTEHNFAISSFRVAHNDTFGKQVEELFAFKYPKSLKPSEMVRIQLLQFNLETKQERNAAQALAPRLAGNNGNHKITATMKFSAELNGKKQEILVSKEENFVIPLLAPAERADMNTFIAWYKTTVDSLMALAITKLDRFLDEI